MRYFNIAIALIVLIAIIVLTTRAVTKDLDSRFLQVNFPCPEDEVLGYSPEFGPDHVGCLRHDGMESLSVIGIMPNEQLALTTFECIDAKYAPDILPTDWCLIHATPLSNLHR